MKRNILDGCRDRGIVLCQVGPRDTLYGQQQPQESRDAGGALVWEEVLAATIGQQKQMKMKMFLFLNQIRISRLWPTCITKQVRVPTQEQENTKSSAFREFSHHLFLSGCFIPAHLCTALQQERGRTHSCSVWKKQLGKAHPLCKASSLQQHKPRNRIGSIKSKSKIAPSSYHLHFR